MDLNSLTLHCTRYACLFLSNVQREMYGGPGGHAMRRYLSADGDVTVDGDDATVDDDDVTVDDGDMTVDDGDVM